MSKLNLNANSQQLYRFHGLINTSYVVNSLDMINIKCIVTVILIRDNLYTFWRITESQGLQTEIVIMSPYFFLRISKSMSLMSIQVCNSY